MENLKEVQNRWECKLPQLRVKVKSLACEAAIIRLEEERAKARVRTETLNGLHWHRKEIVRTAAYETQLAYFLLKKTCTRNCEEFAKGCRKRINKGRVMKMIIKYGPNSLPENGAFSNLCDGWLTAYCHMVEDNIRKYEDQAPVRTLRRARRREAQRSRIAAATSGSAQ